LCVEKLRRLKSLEEEIKRLKSLVNDLSLDQQILQNVLSKKLCSLLVLVRQPKERKQRTRSVSAAHAN
jgi:archaellum component FlaC